MDSILNRSSQSAHFLMPSDRAAYGACPWAPVSKGQVSVFGADVTGDVRLAAADVRTAPGNSAWSPPI